MHLFQLTEQQSGLSPQFHSMQINMPLATSSQRVIPPKILIKITFTFGSDKIIRRAATTFSDLPHRQYPESWLELRHNIE